MSIIGTGDNKRISDIYNGIKSDKIVLQPKFQRKLVWNNKHKENFIETILLGLPFPEIYMAIGDVDLETKETKMLIVDGQQRLTTIYEYIDGSNNISYKTIKKYSELKSKEQKDFLKYNIVIRDLGEISMNDIKKIFKRINSVNYALQAMEISNALYDGEYISTGKKICDYIDLFSIITVREYTRMKDLEFILAIMTTYEAGGYFSGYKEVANYVEQYNDEYKNKKNILIKFHDVSLFINEYSKSHIDSIWINSKSCFFTLFVELLKLNDDCPINNKKNDITKILNDFEKEIDLNKAQVGIVENIYTDFYNAIYQGTSTKKNRDLRGKILSDKFLLLRTSI